MEIINKGETWFLEVTCTSCKAKLRIGEIDVHWEPMPPVDDFLNSSGFEDKMRNYYFRCAECKHKAYLQTKVLPPPRYKYSGSIPAHVLENATREENSK
jgi:ribosomal protein S27E